MDVLVKILTDGTQEDVIKMVKVFKKEFRAKPGWEKGTPKRVNNLTMYKNKIQKIAKQQGKDFKLEGEDNKKDKVHLPVMFGGNQLELLYVN